MKEYEMNHADIEFVERNFTYHAPKENQPERYNTLRNEGKGLAYRIYQCCPPGRERALALTNLEQSLFWANAAIARNE